MSVLLLRAGILTTLQDLGRSGFRRLGINTNGAMDRTAARLINILLGNRENTAVLEMHFPAPRLLFESKATIALGGADFDAQLNNQKIENWRPILIDENDVLNFTRRNSGARLYLSVRGNFAAQEWLGSASTNLKIKVGGFGGRALQKGDRLLIETTSVDRKIKFNRRVSYKLIPPYNSSPKLRVVIGAEWNCLQEQSQKAFLTEKFRLKTESDRMGFRFLGRALELREKVELVSSAVDFGTIQLLPDGQMIILMADHQTTGGYPRIGHVASVDLPLLAQLNPTETIGFEIISIEEAENLWLERETELNYLKAACEFLWSQ